VQEFGLVNTTAIDCEPRCDNTRIVGKLESYPETLVLYRMRASAEE
jgi:hypothetical protein